MTPETVATTCVPLSDWHANVKTWARTSGPGFAATSPRRCRTLNGTTDQTRHQDRVWSVAEHLDDVLSKIHPLEPIELQLLDAQGCVLVEDITVPLALPPFDNSSMDGYAVRVADVAGASEEFPAALTVIGDVAAGQDGLLQVGPGQAARIMTGAPLPPGAET